MNMSDLAIACGVSKSCISLALREDGRVSAETRRRIQTIAANLGYRRNPIVSQLMSALRNSTEVVPPFKGCIALISISTGQVEALRPDARQLGYALDGNVVREDMNATRIAAVLHARGIRGVISFHGISHAAVGDIPCVGHCFGSSMKAALAVCVALIENGGGRVEFSS